MPVTNIEVSKSLPKPTKSAITVVGLTKAAKNWKLALPQQLDMPEIATIDFSLLSLSSEAVTRVPVAGTMVGLIRIPDQITTNSMRELAGTIARLCPDFTEVAVAIDLPSKEIALAFAEGFSLGNYAFTKLKSVTTTRKLKSLKLIGAPTLSTDDLNRVKVVAEHVHELRDLVNTPANLLYPSELANWATAQAKKHTVQVEVWDEKRLAKEKCGGILAVGQGSVRPPRLIKLTHKPRGAKFKLALVGKGITFDTGGLSLKPAASMAGMKYDMTGAATVLNAVLAIARLKLPIEVTAWACVAENMPSGSATRPNDVITARNGKTIEVMNTDAEGRVVLADGLSLASETKPDLIVDIATLTGAATVALGNRYAGLMGEANAISHLETAAEKSGELVWHMPLPAELRSVLDSPIADIANAKLGHTAGGMLIGGLFLQEFIGNDAKGNRLAWAHLDIAGPANNDKEPYGFIPKGGTGTMIRTLVSLAENLSA